MATDPHREFCRRQHRVIGHFLALQAWTRGVDCIVLQREHLESFLGLERFKRARQEWLMEDLRPWFPHQQKIRRFGTKSSLASLFLSRVSLDEHFPRGPPMTTAQRIAKLKPAVRACVFKLPRGAKVHEATMVSQLALLASGLATPRQDAAARGKSTRRSRRRDRAGKSDG